MKATRIVWPPIHRRSTVQRVRHAGPVRGRPRVTMSKEDMPIKWLPSGRRPRPNQKGIVGNETDAFMCTGNRIFGREYRMSFDAPSSFDRHGQCRCGRLLGPGTVRRRQLSNGRRAYRWGILR